MGVERAMHEGYTGRCWDITWYSPTEPTEERWRRSLWGTNILHDFLVCQCCSKYVLLVFQISLRHEKCRMWCTNLFSVMWCNSLYCFGWKGHTHTNAYKCKRAKENQCSTKKQTWTLGSESGRSTFAGKGPYRPHDNGAVKVIRTGLNVVNQIVQHSHFRQKWMVIINPQKN